MKYTKLVSDIEKKDCTSEKQDGNNNYKIKGMTDIIVPIYNAYDDLVLCLESLYENTNLSRNRLILINDNSSDSRIKDYLDKQVGENIIVIHNKENKGFSNNVNIGMAQSNENDVVLLNSDTIVTPNWLEKIRKCAYLCQSTGTVTPLSNNATLCSVPRAFEKNLLPEGLSVKNVGEIVERCSLNKYPRITTSNGFCMYIKREVIDCIGNFDAETFGRGYGEENDFCYRAEQVGYRHVMCDDTYVYHSESRSFTSKEKEEYINAHDEILRKRYPKQTRNNDIYCRDNPNQFVAENVGIYLELANGRKNILYLVQSDFRKDATDNVGGTQFHVRDLVRELKYQYNVFVAARNQEYLNLTVYYGEKERFFKFYIGEKKNFYEFRSSILEHLWKQIFSAFRIDVVHVHHVISTSFDIFYVADEYKIPVILTVHDYYFVCPNVKLLDCNGSVCVGRSTSEDCAKCLHSLCGITDRVSYIKLWRENCSNILHKCKQILVPNSSVVDIIVQYYPSIIKKLKVIEHGYTKLPYALGETAVSINIACCYERLIPEGFSYKIVGWAFLKDKSNSEDDIYLNIKNQSGVEALVPVAKKQRFDVVQKHTENSIGFECVIPTVFLDGNSIEATVVIKRDDIFYHAVNKFETPKLKKYEKSRLNVAFIGGINKEKGGNEIYSIIKALKTDVNWYIFGGIGFDKLECLKQNNLVKTGCYSSEDLSALLRQHQIDIVGIISIWPETYSYTLTESLANQIPAIVTDIGALGRRMHDLKCGWTVSVDAVSKEFIAIIKSVVRNNDELGKYRERICQITLKSAKEMADAIAVLYEENFKNAIEIEYEDIDYKEIFAGYQNAYGLEATGCDELRYMRENAEKELYAIKSTFLYKAAKKIWNTNLPGMRLIKRVVRRYST